MTRPWGYGYLEKNKFQEYYLAIIQCAEDEDWVYFEQLRDELDQEQWLDLWPRLASYTRTKITKRND